MPVTKDPQTPQIMVTPPSPEIYVLVNPSGSKITLKTEPKPMNVPSNKAKATNKKLKSLFFMTSLSVVHKFCCFGFWRLTKLGACSGYDLMTIINPIAINETK